MRIALAVVCFGAMISAAAASDDPDWAKCQADTETRGDDVIAGCTAVIDASKIATSTIAKAHTNRGNVYYERGDKARAIVEYTAALRAFPQHVPALVFRAIAYKETDQAKLALKDLDRAIALRPDTTPALYARGEILMQSGEYDRALADYTRVIELDAITYPAHARRGTIHAMQGKYELAAADLIKAAEANGEDATVLNNLCFTLAAANKDLDRALKDCSRAILLDPNSGAFDSRGFVFFRKGNYKKAIVDFDAALKLTPKTPSALYVRGLARRKLGDAKAGQADIAAALALDPNIAAEYERMGVAP